MCKSTHNIVQVGLLPPDPLMVISSTRMSHRDANGIFVRADDTDYLKDKWRPQGAYNMVEMDVATDVLKPVVVGEIDPDWFGSWTSSTGEWIGPLSALFTITYKSYYDDVVKTQQHVAYISEDGTTLTWEQNGTSRVNGSHQLYVSCSPPPAHLPACAIGYSRITLSVAPPLRPLS